MTAPLFSICLPSRNRFDTAILSINSVLSQDFDDYELLVSDNSTVEKGRLRQWLSSAESTSAKLHFWETDRDLEMHENWEFISKKARGKYVLILADRWLMRRGALKVMARAVEQTDPDLFYWSGEKYGRLEARLANEASVPPIECDVEMASEALLRFLDFGGYKDKTVYGQPIPRGMNSGYRRGLSDEARTIWGDLFRPISPDYTSAMSLLLVGERCLRLREPMYYCVGSKSNFQSTTIHGLNAYRENYPDCDTWRGLKIDATFPTVLNDVERTFSQIEGGKKWIKSINVENAMKCVIWELHYKEFHGSLLDTGEMRRRVYNFAKAMKLTDIQINNIRQYDTENRHRYVGLRRLLRRVGMFENALQLNNAVRYRHRRRQTETIYEVDDVGARELSIS